MDNDIERPLWSFHPSEVQITENIIGRGAFGEVRIGVWRGIDIAVKRLHALGNGDKGPGEQDDPSLNSENLIREIDMLSKLRHPNLVLFLGVTYDQNISHPNTILTELMPGSLYDILEVHKIKLSLPDILDITLDIANGLAYLHGNNPCIIHRDISSKNILIGGNRAKIADLGQSKILGVSINSRQTGMPGAMAYSAPEVLTGKYSAKIDIFSLGVLIVQMVTGEYPRIDRRDEQLQRACSAQIPLDAVMKSCLHYQPSERPLAGQICDVMQSIRCNDRHYPPVRRKPPQSDVGVLARRWMLNEIEERTRSVKSALEQTSRRLSAEEQRWRDEADRSDKAEKKCRELETALNAMTSAFQASTSEAEVMKRAKKEAEDNMEIMRAQMESVQGERKKLTETIAGLEEKCRQRLIEINTYKLTVTEREKQIAALERTTSSLTDKDSKVAGKMVELQMQLDMQVDESRDVEARLEQALLRWKQERENVLQEQARYNRIKWQSVEVQEKNTRLSAEVDRLTSRLRSYESLPMPEEIRQRMQDTDSDLREKELLLVQVNTKKELLEKELAMAYEKVNSLERVVSERVAELADLRLETSNKLSAVAEVELRSKLLEADLATAREMCERLSSNKIGLLENEEILKAQLKELQSLIGQDGGRISSMLGNDIRINTAGSADYGDLGLGDVTGESPGRAAGSEQRGNEVNPSGSPSALPTTAAVRGPAATATAMAETSLQALTVDEAVVEEDEQERKRRLDKTAKVLVQQAIDHIGPSGLLRLLRDHLSDEFITWRGARAVRELVMKDADVRTRMVNERCQDMVVAGLRAFPASALVQSQGLRTIGTLAFGNDLVRRHVGERGGIKALCKALMSHVHDESVVLYACMALANLTHNSLENRSRFLEAGGLPALVAVMESHKTSAKLQRHACSALLTVAGADDGARAASDAGATAVVLAAMMYHRMDASVQQFGCWALGNIALAGDDVRRKMRLCGVPEVCRIALEAHSEDAEVVRQAKSAIGVIGPQTKSDFMPPVTRATSTPARPLNK